MDSRESEQTLSSDLARFLRASRAAILADWAARTQAWRGESRVREAWLDALVAALERGRADGLAPGDESPGRAVADLRALQEVLLAMPGAPTAEREKLARYIDAFTAQLVAAERERDAELEVLRGRIALATQATRIGCWTVDANGGVELDDRARELFDARAVANLDDVLAHVDQEDRTCVEQALRAARDAGEPGVVECRAARADEGAVRWIVMALRRVAGAASGGARVLGVVYDVTDRRRVEEEHSRVVEELSRAVRVSEMFVGILSHDLRNPLSAIVTGSKLLQQIVPPESQPGRVLARVESSSQRMARMIDQLLDFTRARLGDGIPVQPESLDAAKIVGEVVDELRSANAAWTIHVTTTGDTRGSWDPDRLAQIVSNLVGNAVQHGERSAGVQIEIDGTAADRVRLAVRNRGEIPRDILPLVFNPFRGTVQKRDKSKGLGLGLYVARQIALAHGGDIDVESTSERGTVFGVRLPRAALVSAPSRRRETADEEVSAIESLAVPSQSTAVTAQLFGAAPLHERAPIEYWDIVERYGKLLDLALKRHAYRGEAEGLSDELRALAARLGALGAGAREATDVHARALRRAVQGAPVAKAHMLVAEGRLLAIELMGNLVSYYRRRSRAGAPGASGPASVDPAGRTS